MDTQRRAQSSATANWELADVYDGEVKARRDKQTMTTSYVKARRNRQKDGSELKARRDTRTMASWQFAGNERGARRDGQTDDGALKARRQTNNDGELKTRRGRRTTTASSKLAETGGRRRRPESWQEIPPRTTPGRPHSAPGATPEPTCIVVRHFPLRRRPMGGRHGPLRDVEQRPPARSECV